MDKYKSLILLFSILCVTITAMEDGYELLDQTTQSTSIQDKIKSLTTKKSLCDLTYTGLIVGVTAMNICNVIWEEPTLHSDYFGAKALSVGNKINTALALGLNLVDVLWLINPYCAFSHDCAQEKSWTGWMQGAHFSSGHVKSVVASLVGICGGIRRYPRTLTMLTASALLDLAGYINAENHYSIAEEIEDLENESL